MKKLKGYSKLAITFYVFSVVMMLIFAFSCYNVTTYIMALVEAGSITISENFSDIMLYYINNATAYLAYALIIWGIGYIISLLKVKTNDEAVVLEEAPQETLEVVETKETEE